MSNRQAWRHARAAVSAGRRVVLVTLAAVQGSAPREVGACMAVDPDATGGSIGGGRLEWMAIEAAREFNATSGWRLSPFTLSADIGQCCGGRVQLLFETLGQSDLVWLQALEDKHFRGELNTLCSPRGRRKTWTQGGACRLSASATELALTHPVEAGLCDVLLFGAGHVGRAVAALLEPLAFHLHHVETRHDYATPSIEVVDCPDAVLHKIHPGTLVLIMTHDHALDYHIAERCLFDEQIPWIGLIGSHSKRAQLKRRLDRKYGAARSDAALTRLACPIGQSTISRAPAEVATLIVSELLYARERVAPVVTKGNRDGHRYEKHNAQLNL